MGKFMQMFLLKSENCVVRCICDCEGILWDQLSFFKCAFYLTFSLHRGEVHMSVYKPVLLADEKEF